MGNRASEVIDRYLENGSVTEQGATTLDSDFLKIMGVATKSVEDSSVKFMTLAVAAVNKAFDAAEKVGLSRMKYSHGQFVAAILPGEPEGIVAFEPSFNVDFFFDRNNEDVDESAIRSALEKELGYVEGPYEAQGSMASETHRFSFSVSGRDRRVLASVDQSKFKEM